MANLGSAMDSAFWDQRISSPQTLEGSAKSVPGEPFPLDGTRAGRALRIQQLSFLRNGFPLGIIPSLCPPSQKECGSLSLQSLLLRPSTSNWWLGVIGQFRPRKLISNIKAELANVDEWDLSIVKDTAKHFVDKSLYSVAFCTQLSLSSVSSLLWNTECCGKKKGRRNKLMFFHKLRDHDLTLEAAWPELFIDQKGVYWDVPESISLDLSSLASDSGFQYRFGLHKNSGRPQPFAPISGDVPSGLRPGLCAKAACSYGNSKDLWRRKETKEDVMIKTDKGTFWRPAYDVRLKEPHATVSGIVGGTCTVWFGGKNNSMNFESQDGGIPSTIEERSPFNVDIFGSICCTLQHGKFRQRYGDLSRVDARLDMCSGSSFAKRIFKTFKGSSISDTEKQLSSPRLSLIFQQQVAGPIVFRVDSNFSLGSSEKQGPQTEDLRYSLSYSLRLLQSGKVVAWYSPKRKEGMVELRLFEC